MTFPQGQTEKPRLSWIEWFCSLEGHDFLFKVDTDFIKDRINLICLNDKAIGINFDKKRIGECLKLLLSKQQPSEEDLQNEQFLQLN
jgi:casein kinase II subunit beta